MPDDPRRSRARSADSSPAKIGYVDSHQPLHTAYVGAGAATGNLTLRTLEERPIGDDAHKARARRESKEPDYHVEALRRRAARESAQAQVLIDRFVMQAREAALVTEELTARPWSGRGRYRTGVVGWYLRRDHSVGLSSDGRYYVLVVPPVRFGRWRTVHVDPSPPPLQVGQGARDGESISLEALLQLRLNSWDTPQV